MTEEHQPKLNHRMGTPTVPDDNTADVRTVTILGR
jgi:hypothetical protein